MSYFGTQTFNYAQPSIDAGGRMRVSQVTTLGDYKILNADRTLLVETAGTGTGSFSNNKYNMSVTSGQWMVRQSKKFHPYFSGKSQLIEATFDNFHAESNVTKRVGYFSSNAVSPFDSTYDGFWLENDGSTIYLKAARSGTSTLSVALSSWSGYANLGTYQTVANWQNFTVVLFDFLWLGGAVLRVWVKTPSGFVLAHIFHYSSTAQDVFILSPNQPLRYEIRSSTGSGSFRYICAQVATEGSIDEAGLSRAVDTGTTAISMATIGTKYPLIGVRKQTGSRDIGVVIDDLTAYVSSNTDQLRWTLELNPTLSATPTWSNVTNSAIQQASGNGTITVTTAGTVIGAGYLYQNLLPPSSILHKNFLSFLGGTLANVMDEIWLNITPITSTISVFGELAIKEF